MCCNTGIIKRINFSCTVDFNLNIYYPSIGFPNSTKITSALTDKDSVAACVVNTVAGAVSPSTTASPSHSLSPENVIY